MARTNPAALFWMSFFLVIVLLAVITGIAALNGGKQVAEMKMPERSVFKLLIEGESYHVRQSDAAKVAPLLEEQLTQQKLRALEEIQPKLNREIDLAFAEALARVPEFTDWYYTLGGEYTRYAKALTGNMSEFLEEQLEERVFQSAGLEEQIDASLASADGALLHHLESGVTQVAELLREFASDSAIEEDPDRGALRVENSVDVSSVLEEAMAVTSEDIAQEVVAGVAAVGVGTAVTKGVGAAITKQVAAKVMGTQGMKAAGALLAKLAVKLAAKGAGAGSAGAAGAAAGTLCGPGAVVCSPVLGAGAAVATWLLVDKAFVEFDEVLHRDTLEQDIRDAITQQRDDFKEQMMLTYEQVVERRFGGLVGSLSGELTQPREGYVPVRNLESPSEK